MTIRLRNSVTATSTDYGLVLLDETGGEYWNLNPTGASVVTAVLDGDTPDQAARSLAEEHHIDLDTASADVRDLLSQLGSAGLIDWVPA